MRRFHRPLLLAGEHEVPEKRSCKDLLPERTCGYHRRRERIGLPLAVAGDLKVGLVVYDIGERMPKAEMPGLVSKYAKHEACGYGLGLRENAVVGERNCKPGVVDDLNGIGDREVSALRTGERLQEPLRSVGVASSLHGGDGKRGDPPDSRRASEQADDRRSAFVQAGVGVHPVLIFVFRSSMILEPCAVHRLGVQGVVLDDGRPAHVFEKLRRLRRARLDVVNEHSPGADDCGPCIQFMRIDRLSRRVATAAFNRLANLAIDGDQALVQALLDVVEPAHARLPSAFPSA